MSNVKYVKCLSLLLMLYLAQLMFWSSSLLLQLLVAALLLLCLLSRDNPWRLCSSYVDISSTIKFLCTHLRRSTLLIVLCLPRPSAGSITYTLLFPCFCITRYTVLSHESCILFLPSDLFLVYTRSPIINGASLARLSYVRYITAFTIKHSVGG